MRDSLQTANIMQNSVLLSSSVSFGGVCTMVRQCVLSYPLGLMYIPSRCSTAKGMVRYT